jgi:hypothetical protein
MEFIVDKVTLGQYFLRVLLFPPMSIIPPMLHVHSSIYHELHIISGFRRDADEICALLGYNTASSGNPLPTFRDNVSVPSSRVKKSKKSVYFLTLEDGTDTLSRNVGKITTRRCVIPQKSADLNSI